MGKKTKSKSNFIKNIKQTLKYFKDSKKYLFGYATVSILEGVIGAILPIISAKIILNITSGAMKQLLLTALVVFGIDIIMDIIYYFKSYLYQRIYRKTLVKLQVAVARETLKLEVKEIDK